MQSSHPLTWLTFFTLAAGIVIIAGAFAYFLRKRHNRHIAAHALIGDGNSDGRVAPDGAGPELIAVLVLALVVMALLGFGYAYR